MLWQDGAGAPDLGVQEQRSIFAAARGAGVDAIVVHGRRALAISQGIEFRQFDVRDIASIPALPAA